MSKIKIIIYTFFLFINLDYKAQSKENFLNDAVILYEKNKYDESKFLLQRNIVFNPKNYTSYLYLAKIYKQEKDLKEMEKNLENSLSNN